MTGGADRVKDHTALYQPDGRHGPLAPDEGVRPRRRAPAVRSAYGQTPFGQGCLLARRLVQAGVTFVEVRSNGWDTHQEVHDRVGKLAGDGRPRLRLARRRPQDPRDARPDPGRLDGRVRPDARRSTRTPAATTSPASSTSPWPAAASRGARSSAPSSADGTEVKDQPGRRQRPARRASATPLKIDPTKENMSPLGRPIKIVDGGKVVKQLFA